jgi:hypothetical protein
LASAFTAFSAFAVAKVAAAFSAFEAFTFLLRFWLLWRWCFFVFLADFFYAFGDVVFECVADVVAFSECVCSGCDGEFACDDAGDLSTLPAFSIVK